MIGAVVKRRLESDDRVAGEHALGHAVAQALLDRGEEVLRDGAAEHFLFEDHFIALAGLKADPHVAELAVAAGLLLVSALNLDLLADLLTVRHLRILKIDGNAGLAVLQLGDDNVELSFAHAADDLLLRFGVVLEGDGGILFHQLAEAGSDLFFIALRLGSDGFGEAGLREIEDRHDGLVALRAEGVAGGGGGHLRYRADVAGGDGIDLDLLLADDIVNVGDLFGRVRARIVYRHIRLDLAGVNAEVGDLSDEVVGDGLEDLGDGSAGFDLLGINWRREHVGDAVEQRNDAGERQRDAGIDGADGAVDYALGDAVLDLGLGEGFAGEVLLHQLFADFGDALVDDFFVMLDALGHVIRNRNLLLDAVLEGVRFVVEQVDEALELSVLYRGQDDRNDLAAVDLVQLVEGLVEVGVLVVDAVDEEHTGKAVLLAELHSLVGADGVGVVGGQNDDSRVRGGGAADGFALKVEVTGSVDRVDLGPVPVKGRE